MLLPLSCLFAYLICLIQGDNDQSANVEGRVQIPDNLNDLTQFRVTLNSGEHVIAPLQSNGRFEIKGVLPGRYVLEVEHPFHVYAPVLIEISPRSAAIAAYALDIEKGRGSRLQYPLQLTSTHQLQVFIAERTFDILYLLENPMVLITVISLLLMYFINKLRLSVDPEEFRRLGVTSDVQPYRSAFLDKGKKAKLEHCTSATSEVSRPIKKRKR